MDTPTLYEIVGYVASGLVAVSLTMRSILRLRVLNLVGSLVFTVYGLLIDAPPVWAVNAFIAVVNLRELVRLTRVKERLEVLEVPADSPFLRRFLEIHQDDIARAVPAFGGLREEHRPFLVLRSGLPAAVVLARMEEARVLVDLDYAVPSQRDLVAGRHLYGPDGPFAGRFEDHEVWATPGDAAHRRYLKRVGFAATGERWRLERMRPPRGGG